MEYIDGDTFIQDSSEGLLQYLWDDVNSVWSSPTKLNGLRVLTASDFPDEIQLDLRATNFLSDKAFSNDYYLNKTLNLLFSYSATTGFAFGSQTFDSYQGFRAPTTHEIQGTDMWGYQDPIQYIFDVVTSDTSPLSDKEKRVYRMPIHQDRYHIKLEDDEGHGGFVWYFDAAIPVDVLNTFRWQDALIDKLGISQTAQPLDARYYFREAKTFNENGTPVQNNKKYRQGDNVFDVVNGVLYYNYNEFAPANTTDLGVLFEGQTTLAGSSLKTAQISGVWQDPTADDSKYKQGDYIFTKSRNTPRIHGPYKFGANTDKEAWPLFSVLRQPIVHVNTSATALINSFDVSEYPVDINGDMIVDGDTWEKVYVADLANANDDTKRVTLSKGVVIDYTANTLDWGTETTNNRPSQFWRQDTVGQPVRDDNSYYSGDYKLTLDGAIYGPYAEGAADNTTAWPFFTSLRANKSVRALDVATNYVPSQANNATEWGGATIAEGDTLYAYFAGSTSGKMKEYLATDIDVADANKITWTEIGKPAVKHFINDLTWPTVNDANYTDGDFIENGSGIRFGPYVEGQLTADFKTAWPVSTVVRAARKFSKNGFLFATQDVNTFLPVTGTYEIEDTAWGVDNQNLMLVVGDTFTFNGTDGKVKTFEVQAVDYSAENNSLVAVDDGGSSTIHNSNATATPQRNDNLYSTGDFIINGNGVMYGPYVEGQATDVLAWPLKQSLRDNVGIIADTGSVDAGKNWKFVVENGIIRIEEIV